MEFTENHAEAIEVLIDSWVETIRTKPIAAIGPLCTWTVIDKKGKVLLYGGQDVKDDSFFTSLILLAYIFDGMVLRCQPPQRCAEGLLVYSSAMWREKDVPQTLPKATVLKDGGGVQVIPVPDVMGDVGPMEVGLALDCEDDEGKLENAAVAIAVLEELQTSGSVFNFTEAFLPAFREAFGVTAGGA